MMMRTNELHHDKKRCVVVSIEEYNATMRINKAMEKKKKKSEKKK